MTMNFFAHVRITFKYLRFFLNVIGRKLTKIKTILPLPKTPVLGGYDGYPRDFSGDVVGGLHFFFTFVLEKCFATPLAYKCCDNESQSITVVHIKSFLTSPYLSITL